jgi:hypothetical protein
MALEVHSGIHEEMEAKATELIMASLEGVTSREAKSDILTPWKERHRARHEFLTHGAPVDPAVRRGTFSKAYNRDKPNLNSYEGATRPPKMIANWDPENAMPSGRLSPQMSVVAGVECDDR